MRIYVDVLPDCKHDCPFQDFCNQYCDRFEKDGVTKTDIGKDPYITWCKVLEVKEDD